MARDPLDPDDLQPSADLGPEPIIEWLAPDDLMVDGAYQRPLTEKSRDLIARIVERFTWARFQPPVVAVDTDGKMRVIDGQHRVEAARLHPGIERIPCYIVEAPETVQQADGFLAANRDRLPVHSLAIFHAEVAAKRPDALHIKAVLDAAGVTVPRRTMPLRDMKPRTLMSLATVADGLKNFGDRPVIDALKILAEVSESEEGPIRAPLLKGLIPLYGHSRDRPVIRDRLFKALTRKSTEELVRAARAYKDNFGGTTAAALRAAITNEYNTGLSQQDRLLIDEPQQKAAA